MTTKQKDRGYSVVKWATPIVISLLGFAMIYGGTVNKVDKLETDVDSVKKIQSTLSIEMAVLNVKLENIEAKQDLSDTKRDKQTEEILKQIKELKK